jgi:hypothetical protein
MVVQQPRRATRREFDLADADLGQADGIAQPGFPAAVGAVDMFAGIGLAFVFRGGGAVDLGLGVLLS